MTGSFPCALYSHIYSLCPQPMARMSECGWKARLAIGLPARGHGRGGRRRGGEGHAESSSGLQARQQQRQRQRSGWTRPGAAPISRLPPSLPAMLTKGVPRDALPGVGVPQPDLVIKRARGQQGGLARVEAHDPRRAAVPAQHPQQAPARAAAQLHRVVAAAGGQQAGGMQGAG